MRSRLTYANVVATLALILAVGGGTVYAAIKLGKNDVKSKHIAKGAVKGKDLGRNAVSSVKVKDGSIGAGDLAAGVFEGLDVDTTGSAASGPRGGINTNATSPLPLGGDTTFTPAAGEVGAIAAEARFTTATTDPTQYCSPAIFVSVNGQPTRIYLSPTGLGNSTTPETTLSGDADGPFGLVSPGTPLTVSAEIQGDEHCTAGSQLNRLEIRILQIR